MYDWANSAFVTTIVSAFLPIYYSKVAASEFTKLEATAYWGYTTAIALAIIALLSPVLGAVADYMGAKKRFLAVFMGFGVTFSALLYFVGEGDWLLASAIIIVASIGFSGANVFYEALLPSVSAKFGGIAGPLVFATVGLSMGSSRWGILSLVGFFAVGAWLLRHVNVGAGQRLAREVDSAMHAAAVQG
jgi:MFS-type transporter involved in bile tolerance (Atg22 family)